MTVYMEEANGMINLELSRQVFADTLLQMNGILACNVINDHHTLLRIHASCPQGLEEGKVDVFLLFSFE